MPPPLPPPLPSPLPASLRVTLGHIESGDSTLVASFSVDNDGIGCLHFWIDDHDSRKDSGILGGENLLDCLRQIVANADQVIADLRSKGQLKRIGWS